MIEPLPFLPGRFGTAAAHYVEGRPSYPPSLIARVAALVGLGKDDRVIDLGCGPGQLAALFAPYAGEVVGIDPSSEMLAVARETTSGLPNVVVRQGSSYDIAPDWGPARLVTMGRSFHWMDRVDTLRRLDDVIVAGGAIALINDDHPAVPDNAWYKTCRAVLRSFSDETSARWRADDWVRHEAVLLDSPFSRIESVSVIERRPVTAELMITRAFSLSSTAAALEAGRGDELKAAIRDVVPEGAREVVEITALLAWRP